MVVSCLNQHKKNPGQISVSCVCLGMDNFEKLLDGGFYMDQHFKTAPLEQNVSQLQILYCRLPINMFIKMAYDAMSKVLRNRCLSLV